MDELNEAYLDRLISRMKSSFGNLSEVLDDSFYKMFKDNYREMGNNYIDRSTIREIASEYR